MFESFESNGYLVLEALGGEEGLVLGGIDHLIEGRELAAHEMVHHLHLYRQKTETGRLS